MRIPLPFDSWGNGSSEWLVSHCKCHSSHGAAAGLHPRPIGLEAVISTGKLGKKSSRCEHEKKPHTWPKSVQAVGKGRNAKGDRQPLKHGVVFGKGVPSWCLPVWGPCRNGGGKPRREELLAGREYAHLCLIGESTGFKRNIPDHMSYQCNHKIGGAGDPAGCSRFLPFGCKAQGGQRTSVHPWL